jgi:hypothetical protein
MSRGKRKQRHKAYVPASRVAVKETWTVSVVASKRRAAAALATEKLIAEVIAESQATIKQCERRLRRYK